MSKQITQIEKNTDTNTILFKNAAGDIVTACYAGGLIAEEREAGTKVLVMTTDRKPLVSLTVADITTPVVADAQALLIELADNFFFDLGGGLPANVKEQTFELLGQTTLSPALDTLASIPVPENSTVYISMTLSAKNTANNEDYSNVYSARARNYGGVITLSNATSAVTEIMTNNPVFATSTTLVANTFSVRVNVGTVAQTLDWIATIKTTTHQF